MILVAVSIGPIGYFTREEWWGGWVDVLGWRVGVSKIADNFARMHHSKPVVEAPFVRSAEAACLLARK